ncbi:MAG: hypothetical protein JHC33_10570 [Ignisphaera sp.]|nr:hypothetical protein [Ignisphaera sp.]
MSSAIFQLLNMSTGTLVTVQEYNRATFNFMDQINNSPVINPYRPSISEDATKSWYVSPPSDTDITRLALYLNIPMKALDIVIAHQGYAYDPE